MDDKKQIEELAEIIEIELANDFGAGDIVDSEDRPYQAKGMAKILFDKGYRKMDYMPIMSACERDKIRERTAKDILQEWANDNRSMGIENALVAEIATEYGVQLDDTP